MEVTLFEWHLTMLTQRAFTFAQIPPETGRMGSVARAALCASKLLVVPL